MRRRGKKVGFSLRAKDKRESLFLEGIGRGSRVLLCDPLEFFFVFFKVVHPPCNNDPDIDS